MPTSDPAGFILENHSTKEYVTYVDGQWEVFSNPEETDPNLWTGFGVSDKRPNLIKTLLVRLVEEGFYNPDEITDLEILPSHDPDEWSLEPNLVMGAFQVGDDSLIQITTGGQIFILFYGSNKTYLAGASWDVVGAPQSHT